MEFEKTYPIKGALVPQLVDFTYGDPVDPELFVIEHQIKTIPDFPIIQTNDPNNIISKIEQKFALFNKRDSDEYISLYDKIGQQNKKPLSSQDFINDDAFKKLTQPQPSLLNLTQFLTTKNLIPPSGNGLLPLPSLANTRPVTNNSYLGSTKPEDLPEMALPILEYMEEVQPHIVIACDRGARLFGLAIHAAWRQTRDGQPFPTLDGKLHFARISKTEEFDVLQEKIDTIVNASMRSGVQRGDAPEEDERLRVLFVDDWVIGGGTKRLAIGLMKKHDADTYFAVMCGDGADASGSDSLNTRVSWHDIPEEIGVNYLSTIHENTDGTIGQEQKAVAVRSLAAARNRKKIQKAARNLAVTHAMAEMV